MSSIAFYTNEFVSTTLLNLWTAVLLVTLAVMITIGLRQYQLVDSGDGSKELMELHGNGYYVVVAAVATFIFTIIYVIEERYVLSFPRIILGIALFAFSVYFAGMFTSWARYGYLSDKQRKATKKQRRRNR